MRACNFILVVAITTVFCTLASPSVRMASACPWRTIANVDDLRIQSFGRWALEQAHVQVSFDKVKHAWAQAGGNCASNINLTYELIIEASTHNASSAYLKFKALVSVVGETQLPKELLSCDPIIDEQSLCN